MAGRIGHRVRRLEALQGTARPEPSATELEVWAIDAKIARLEREISAAGGSVDEVLQSSTPEGLTLDEEIAWLEQEIERLELEDD